MSAPTVWEEGRWSGTRITRFSISACAFLVAVDIAVSADLGTIFDLGFVALCLLMALAIRPADFFHVGVLPPMLLLGLCVLLGLVDKRAIAPTDDGLVQAVISGLAHHAGSLLIGYTLALAVLAIRARVLRRHGVAVDEPFEQLVTYSNLEVSPAPTLVTSAEPEVKSTTVVGNEPDSPSMTASSS